MLCMLLGMGTDVSGWLGMWLLLLLHWCSVQLFFAACGARWTEVLDGLPNDRMRSLTEVLPLLLAAGCTPRTAEKY